MIVEFNREQALKAIAETERQFLELQNRMEAPKSRSMWALFFSGKNNTKDDALEEVLEQRRRNKK